MDVAVGRDRRLLEHRPVRVEGEEQPLGDFPRHESPWGGIEHLSRQYNLTAGASTWSCDFDTMARELS